MSKVSGVRFQDGGAGELNPAILHETPPGRNCEQIIRLEEGARQHLFIKINVLTRRDRVAEGGGALGHDSFDLGFFYF